ncbi:hypothetical protein G6F31_018670 [Rhizopus arrhizus]|nr:hypothetical protein G6F31_018670 [Rhizopus arrhizus]
MGADHAAWADTLGARRLHEIHPDDFQHRRAHDAQIGGQEDQRKRGGGQHKVPGDVQDARPARVARGDGRKATCRHPVQPDGDDENAHQPEPERRRGAKHQAQRGDQRVRPAVDAPRRDHAQRHAAGQGEGQRRPHQQQRGRQA